jgi:Uncharacterized protein family UPF0004
MCSVLQDYMHEVLKLRRCCDIRWMQLQVVLSILRDAGYDQTDAMADADVVLVNTCAIREGVHMHDRIRCAPMYLHCGERGCEGMSCYL